MSRADDPLSAPGGPSLAWLAGCRSIAVFGASDRGGVHRVLLDNVGLGGGVATVGVNPRRSEAHGMPCVPTAADLPDGVDAAVMLVADARVDQAVADGLDAGIRAFVVPGLGIAPETVAIRDRLAARIREAGALMLGPDGMGLAVPQAPSPWIGTLPASLRAGGISVVTQSGAVGEALIAAGPRFAMRLVASVGSELTHDAADVLAFLAGDEPTEAVGLFLEVARRPAAVAEAVATLARLGIPVVCLNTGRSPAAIAAGRAHSGAPVGDAAATASLLRDAGGIVVDDFAEFMEALALVQSARWPAGPRIAAVTNSGGEAQLIADEADRAGIPFAPLPEAVGEQLLALRPRALAPVNPVDGWCAADVERTYRDAFAILAASGDFDTLLAVVDQSPYLEGMEVTSAEQLIRALLDVAGRHALPAVVVSSLPSEPVAELERMAERAGAATLRGHRAALRALAAVVRWSERRATAAEAPPAPG